MIITGRAMGTSFNTKFDVDKRLLNVHSFLVLSMLIITGCATVGVLSKEDIFQSSLTMGKIEFGKEYDEQNFNSSLKYLLAAEKMQPNNQEVHYYLGYTYERLSRYDGSMIPSSILGFNIKSSDHFQKVVEIDPIYRGEIYISDPYTKLTSIWGAMGMAFFTRGQMDSAIWAFNYGKSVGGFNPALLEINKNLMRSCEKNAILLTGGDNDTFPLWYLQLIEGFRQDITVVNLSLLNSHWYIKQLKDNYPFGPNNLALNISNQEIDSLGVMYWEGDTVEARVMPDSVNVGGVMRWYLEPTFWDNMIRVQDMMVVLIVDANAAERPIYFAGTVSSENFIGLGDHVQYEGLVYRLAAKHLGNIAKGQIYRNCFELYTYQGSLDEHQHYSPDLNGMYQNLRQCFMVLATAYYRDGDFLNARKCIDYMNEKIPQSIIPYPNLEFQSYVEQLDNMLRDSM